MAQVLGRVFPIVASEWEEQLAAAAFLHEVPFLDSAFDAATAGRVRLLLDSLRLLPATWARELASEALQGAEDA